MSASLQREPRGCANWRATQQQVWHPDKHAQNPKLHGRTTKKAQELNAAWATIRAWRGSPDAGDAEAQRQQAEQERAARERAERDRAERVARERAERENAARERAARERAEREKAERERAARERAEREKAERERVARERAEEERAARAKAESEYERVARERARREMAEYERMVRERTERSNAEYEQAAHAERERKRRARVAQETAGHEPVEPERRQCDGAQQPSQRERAPRSLDKVSAILWALRMVTAVILVLLGANLLLDAWNSPSSAPVVSPSASPSEAQAGVEYAPASERTVDQPARTQRLAAKREDDVTSTVAGEDETRRGRPPDLSTGSSEVRTRRNGGRASSDPVNEEGSASNSTDESLSYNDLVNSIVQKGWSLIQYCYQEQLVTNQTLGGKIIIQFVIEPDGSVSSATTQWTDMHSQEVESCLEHRFKTFRYPPPPDGLPMKVHYPMLFWPK